MDPRTPLLTRLGRSRERWRRLTGSVTAGGMMLVGMPLALEYVVRPGDTLSEIAARHDTTVDRLVARNDLHSSGDRIVAGQSLDIPAAHPRSTSGAGSGSHTASPDARRIVSYTVRPGDTPSGLAVRFHAWTAELIERNGSVLRVGEQIEIPVVVAAAAKAGRARGSQPSASPAPARHRSRSTATGPTRSSVRQVITATARRHGVDPNLALAVSWQEAGWQMHHVSSAGAIGAMQVMPSTGRWMSSVLGTDLNLRDVRDNATAGVLLLDLLQKQAPVRKAVAGYYQGLAGVRAARDVPGHEALRGQRPRHQAAVRPGRLPGLSGTLACDARHARARQEFGTGGTSP